MEMVLCSIYDSKAEAFSNPMSFQSVAQAMRAFGDHINDPGSDMHRHPEDYVLFHVGTFDQRSSNIEVVPSKAVSYGQDVFEGSPELKVEA